jgi:glycosyltransferase involved in cell wall biosynthesis
MAHINSCLIHLYLYGLGPEEKSLQKLTEEVGVKNCVTFMGWTNEADVIWKNIDLLLFPSLHEGAPNAILEALAYDVPVLASDLPEHREILPGCNLVAASDVMAWVEILRAILADTPNNLAKIREKQRKVIPKLRFDWEAEIQRRILAGIS